MNTEALPMLLAFFMSSVTDIFIEMRNSASDMLCGSVSLIVQGA
jgi:hypothetical protein